MPITIKDVKEVTMPVLELWSVHRCSCSESEFKKMRDMKEKDVIEWNIKRVNDLKTSESHYLSIFDGQGTVITRLPNDTYEIQYQACALETKFNLTKDQMQHVLAESQKDYVQCDA